MANSKAPGEGLPNRLVAYAVRELRRIGHIMDEPAVREWLASKPPEFVANVALNMEERKKCRLSPSRSRLLTAACAPQQP
ncbi:hypothetical protein ABNQ39_07060 [Azospirillum sp. A26]|uniref:hypothetical protein n=1 Tax=Azospirillum sp. A26 TaxID=3160607 RepID=UPI003670085D